MKKIFLIFFVFNISIISQSDFDFEFDYAQYKYDSTSNFVEFYYSFNQSSFNIGSEDSATSLEGLLKISILDAQNGDTVVFNQWKVNYNIDTSITRNQVLVGTLGFVIPSGTFNCEIQGSDINNPDMLRVIKEQIIVNPYSNGNSEY